MKIKVSDYIVKFFEEKHLQDLFLLPGGACIHLVDSFGQSKKISLIANLHEQACAIGAESYAQYKNKVSVCLVTAGPGATNAITGLLSAYIDSVPVVFLSGQAKTTDLKGKSSLRQKGPQEADIISIVQSITKYAVTITNPNTVAFHLEKAYELAKDGRTGPVWLDIPLDVQGAIVETSKFKHYKCLNANHLKRSKKSVEDKVSALVKLINESRRPVIMAGNGIYRSDSSSLFKTLISDLPIPVLTTWKAIDLIGDDHENFCGRPGTIALRHANFIQQNADLLICLGARLDLLQVAFNYKNFASNAKKIIVDIDKSELDKLEFRPALKIQSHLNLFLSSLLKKRKKIKVADYWIEWLDWCKSKKEQYEYRKSVNRNAVDLYNFIDLLSDILDHEAIIVPGSSGACSEVLMQIFKVKEGQRIVNSPGLGSMGFGLPAAIGVCIASGKKETICINGDGGLQHNLQELQTIKTYQLPIKLFVLNNDGYKSIENTQKSMFGDRQFVCNAQTNLMLPDIEAIANAYKIPSITIESEDNLEAKVREVLSIKGPCICNLLIRHDQQTSPRVKSVFNPDGTIQSLPMEDLFPFLSREEFETNILY